MYLSNYDKERLEKSKEALIKRLRRSTTPDQRDIASAIEAFIDMKIEIALSDLDDKINKRGMYDPDY